MISMSPRVRLGIGVLGLALIVGCEAPAPPPAPAPTPGPNAGPNAGPPSGAAADAAKAK